MKMLFTFVFVVATSFAAEAKITALFHPYDNTLKAIADIFATAESRIDIAMYNLETSDKSEVIAFLKTPAIQERINNKSLKIRMLFEGYGTDEQNAVRMKEVETIGIDVRFLGAAKKVHHKFAIVDGHTANPRLITGSANWSLSSLKSYNENILFAEGETELAQAYQEQFEMLWKYSKAFENDLQIAPIQIDSVDLDSETQAYFNSVNFKFSAGGVKNNPKAEGFHLTRQVIRAIEGAEHEIEIASTRLKLRPIFEALKAAGERGVKIKMIISQDDFIPLWVREGEALPECTNVFDAKCSSGISFGSFLDQVPNAEVRVKYYNLRYSEYISRQMHSKYILIDGKHLLTGSFNWSVSSEQNHIENLVELSGAKHADLMAQYDRDFTNLWDMGRAGYDDLLKTVQAAPVGSETLTCAFEPMVLEYEKIDALLLAFKDKKCLAPAATRR